jgi:uncharacterized protein (TIGR03086 family)
MGRDRLVAMSKPNFATRFVTTCDVLSGYDQVVAYVERLIGQASERYTAPTPCAQWTVRDLVCHLAFVNHRYAEVAEESEHPPFSQRSYPDPAAAFGEWAQRARVAFRQPGFLDKVITTPIGAQPGAVVVQHVLNELLVHGWDLAKALGQPTDFLPDLARQSLTSWREVYTEMGEPPRSPATIDTPRAVTGSATSLDQLAAYMGRDIG